MNYTLFRKYCSGKATWEEKKEFLDWIDSHPAHKEEYMQARRIFDFQIWNPELQKNAKSDKKLYLYFKQCLKVVAIFIVAWVFFWYYSANDEKSALCHSVYVPAGQRAEISLPDGSKVWLNSKTTLTYPLWFGDNERMVTVNGEAYFEVAKDTEHPFIVQTKKYNIQVLGTEFNVISYEDYPYFETTLLKGSVKLSSKESGNDILMQPNMRVSDMGGHIVNEIISSKNQFLWRDGILFFNNASIGQIMKKLELYYDVKIILRNASLKNIKYTGKFRIKYGAEQVLKVLQIYNDFSYQKDEENNVITIQ